MSGTYNNRVGHIVKWPSDFMLPDTSEPVGSHQGWARVPIKKPSPYIRPWVASGHSLTEFSSGQYDTLVMVLSTAR